TPASSSSRYRLLQNGTPRQALHICAGTSSPASNRSILKSTTCFDLRLLRNFHPCFGHGNYGFAILRNRSSLQQCRTLINVALAFFDRFFWHHVHLNGRARPSNCLISFYHTALIAQIRVPVGNHTRTYR